jgi:hypothetical protein
MSSIISLLVDGKERRPTVFAIPEMSLSSARSHMIKREFSISIAAPAVIALLEPSYAAWVIDSKEDDEQSGSPQDELAEAGYPSLSQVLATPQLLNLVVGHYLFQDLITPHAWDGAATIEYWFDEVTTCRLSDDIVEFEGICYSKH